MIFVVAGCVIAGIVAISAVFLQAATTPRCNYFVVGGQLLDLHRYRRWRLRHPLRWITRKVRR